jgi:HEAT repeat protein
VRSRRLTWAVLVVAVCGLPVARIRAQNAPALDRARSPVENLRSKDVDVRRDAASQVRMSDRSVQRTALPVMIDLLLKEKDGQVRLAVLDTVTAMGRDAEAAVPALVQTLRTSYGGQGLEELHQDYRSALALAAVGKPAVEGLRGLLKERKENVRAESIMGLGRIGPDAEAAVPDLIPLLGDKSERIRREAAVALGRIGAAAVEPLIAASAHKDAIVRASAMIALGNLPAPTDRAHPAVLKGAHDAVAAVRVAALKSLARFPMPDEVLVPVLAENLHHDDESIRLAAIDLLVGRPTLLARMAPELQALLTAKSDSVSRHAAFLLGKLGAPAVPRLLDALRETGSRIDQIAEALAQIGRPAVGSLSKAVKAPESRVRRGAALALGQIRPPAPGTVPKLMAGLDDADPDARAAFLTAIGYLGPRAGESVPAVRALLQDPSPGIRIEAVHILYESAPRDDRLLGDLRARVDDADARVQRRAIDTIRFLGAPGRKVLPAVIGKLNSPDAEVRLAAAEMIGSHGQAAAEAVPGLIALLDDPAPKIRTIAAQTLGQMGKAAQPALARLSSLLGAEQVEVREAATVTLGGLELEAEVVRPALARALRDDKTEVRRAAMKAIQRFGPQGAIFIPDIIVLAGGKEPLRTVERSLRRFERRGPDARSLPELLKLLEHKEATVRLLAIRYLGLAGPGAREAIPALERMREDPSAEVRKQAETVGKQIKSKSDSARPKSDSV